MRWQTACVLAGTGRGLIEPAQCSNEAGSTRRYTVPDPMHLPRALQNSLKVLHPQKHETCAKSYELFL